MADSAQESASVSKDTILYDVWIHEDATLQPDQLVPAPAPLEAHKGAIWKTIGTGILNSLFGIFGLRIGGGPFLPQTVLDHLNSLPSYCIESTPSGDKIALLWQGKLSIRVSEDNFDTVAAEHKPSSIDPHPQLQRLAWAEDGSILCLVSSNGEIIVFDGANLAQLGSLDLKQRCSADFSHGTAGLFVRLSTRRGGQTFEAVVASFSGLIYRIVIPLDSDDPIQVLSDFEKLVEHEKTISWLDVSKYHSRCVALAYHPHSNTMAIAGLPENSPSTTTAASIESATISLWKIVDSAPFFSFLQGDLVNTTAPTRHLASKRHTFQSLSTLIRITFNTTGDLLASLDIQGQVSIFRNGLRIKSYSSEVIYQSTKIESIIEMPPKDRIVRGMAWWDDSSLVLARANGDVIVFGPVVALSSSAATPHNRLGAAPERFSPGVIVTSASSSGRFFLFDTENTTVRVPRAVRVPEGDSSSPAPASSSDPSDETETMIDESTAIGKSPEKKKSQSLGPLSTLFGGSSTDPSATSPVETSSSSSPLGPKYVSRKQTHYRLMSLSSTTPERLFLAKLEAGEFGYALKLAQLYDFPTDLVWQRRFILETVTKYSIDDFLSKVKDLRWVLRECKRRVAITELSQKALLEYGLEAAIPTVLKQPYAASSSPTAALLASQLLSLQDCEILLYRLIFLKLLDLLSTFSAVCRSTSRSYDPESWLKFRSSHLISSAIDFAVDEQCNALDILFTYHSEQTLPYRLHLLECIPSTCHTDTYMVLLPALENSSTAGVEEDWDRRRWRSEPDWAEDPSVLQHLIASLSNLYKSDEISSLSVENFTDLNEILHVFSLVFSPPTHRTSSISSSRLSSSSKIDLESRSPDFYAPEDEQPAPFPYKILPRLDSIVPVPSFPLPKDIIARWVVHHARALERRTGQVDFALRFLQLFSPQMTSTEVSELYQTLSTLRTLVYECGKVNMSLRDLENLSQLDCFSFLLEPLPEPQNKAQVQNIANLIRTRAGAILRDERRRWNDGQLTSSEGSVLAQWLVHQSKNHRFDLCAPVILASHPDDPVESRIISNNEALIAIALEVCYASPDATDDIRVLMDQIFCIMPLCEDSEAVSPRMTQLQEQLDAFDTHLSAMETLLLYSCAKPIGLFLTEWSSGPQGNAESVRQLLGRCAQRGVRSKPAWTPSQWSKLLLDLRELCKTVFSGIVTEEYVYAQFCKALLKAGQWALARRYLEDSVGPDDLIVSAAVEYFNSCSSPFDDAMQSAVDCLNIVLPPAPLAVGPNETASSSVVSPSKLVVTPAIRAELDLIEGAKRLYTAGLEILPLQLRTARNRLTVMKPLFEKPSNWVGSKLDEITAAAELIGLTRTEDKHAIRQAAAEAAQEAHNYVASCSLCFELIKIGATKHWPLCLKLAQSEGHSTTLPLESRMKLAAFAALHCPKRDTEQVIALWRALEARNRCSDLGLDEDDSAISTQENDAPIGSESSLSHQNILHACMQKLVDLDSSEVLQRGAKFVLSSAPSFTSDDFACLSNDFYGRKDPNSPSIYASFDAKEIRSANVVDVCKTAIFRLSHLTQSAHSARISAAQHVAASSLKKGDIALFVTAAFSLDSPQKSKELFDNVIGLPSVSPRDSERLTRIATYFFGINSIFQLLSSQRSSKHLKSLEIDPRPHLLSVDALIQLCDEKIGPLISNIASEATGGYWSLYQAFRARLSDFGRVAELQALHVDVDITRFGMDDSYKRGIIVSLAKSLDPQSLNRAVELAAKYRTPDVTSVLSEHLLYYFTTPQSSGVDPHDYMKSYEASLFSRPDMLAAQLESVFGSINHSDFHKYAYWYELKRDTALSTRAARFASKEDAQREAKLCELHLKLLAKLSKIRPHVQVDYPKLCLSAELAAAQLEPVVNETNVYGLAKACPEISAIMQHIDSDNSEITSSSVFLALIKRLLTPGAEYSIEQVIQHASSSSLGKHLTRLDPHDLGHLTKIAVIGSAEAILTPLEARLNTAHAIAELLASEEYHKRLQKEKFTDSTVTPQDIEAAESHLRFLKKLWDWLRSWHDGNVSFNRRAYFEQFDVAFRDGAAFNAAFKQMLANGVEPNIVGYFAVQTRLEESQRWKVQKRSILDLQTLYKTVLEETIKSLHNNGGADCSHDGEEDDNDTNDSEVYYSDEKAILQSLMEQKIAPFPPDTSRAGALMLEALLNALKDSNGPVTFDDSSDALDKIRIFVFDKLRAVCSDNNSNKDVRIAVLRLLLRHKELYSVSKPSRLALHRSDAQLLEALTSSQIIHQLISTPDDPMSASMSPNISNGSTTSIADKISLFGKLLAAADVDATKLAQIGDLLRVWTKYHINSHSPANQQGLASRRLQAEEEEPKEVLQPFSACWRQLLSTLADHNAWKTFWSVCVSLPESPVHQDRLKFMTDDDEEAVFNHVASRPDGVLHAIKYGLKGCSYRVIDLATEKLEEIIKAASPAKTRQSPHLTVMSLFSFITSEPQNNGPRLLYGKDYDLWLILLILRRNLLHLVPVAPKHPSSVLFRTALNVLLWVSEESRHLASFSEVFRSQDANASVPSSEIEAELSSILKESFFENDASISFEATIAALTFRSHFAMAGHLALIHRNVPESLQNVQTGLLALPQYLSEKVLRLQQQQQQVSSSAKRSQSSVDELSEDQDLHKNRLSEALTWEQCRLNCREALQAFSEAMGL